MPAQAHHLARLPGADGQAVRHYHLRRAALTDHLGIYHRDPEQHGELIRVPESLAGTDIQPHGAECTYFAKTILPSPGNSENDQRLYQATVDELTKRYLEAFGDAPLLAEQPTQPPWPFVPPDTEHLLSLLRLLRPP